MNYSVDGAFYERLRDCVSVWLGSSYFCLVPTSVMDEGGCSRDKGCAVGRESQPRQMASLARALAI